MIHVKVGTTFKKVTKMWARDGNGWKLVSQAAVKVGQNYQKV